MLHDKAGDGRRSDDERMHAGLTELLHILLQPVKIILVRQHVHGHMDRRAMFAGKSSALADILQRKIAGTRTQRELTSADIDRVRPIADSSLQALQITSRRKQFDLVHDGSSSLHQTGLRIIKAFAITA